MVSGGIAVAAAALLAMVPFAGPSARQTAPTAATPAALSLHPKNRHYFRFRGKATVLVGSGVYGAVLHRDFDYIVYLNELHRLKLNHTRLFTGSFVARSSVGGDDYPETLVPRDRLLAPWARSATPGYAMGGNKFDLARWDPDYFNRLRGFVAAASKRGVVVEVVLFSANYGDWNWSASPLHGANNVNGVGHVAANAAYVDRDPALTRAQVRLAEKIVTELKDFDNVYYEPLNEPYHAACPGAVGPCEPPKAWEDRIIAVIHQTDRALGRRHLIARGVGDWGFAIRNPHRAVSVLNFHYARPHAVRENYKLGLAIAADETGFRGPGDDPYRTEGWEFLLSGGSVFSNLDWSFTADRENGTHVLPPDFYYGGGGVALRRQIAFLKRFLESFDLVRLRPARSVVRQGAPPGSTVHALGQRGRQYAIYVGGGEGVARLHLGLPRGRYRLQWYDTKSGRLTKRTELKHGGGNAVVVSPRYADGLALAVRSLSN